MTTAADDTKTLLTETGLLAGIPNQMVGVQIFQGDASAVVKAVKMGAAISLTGIAAGGVSLLTGLPSAAQCTVIGGVAVLLSAVAISLAIVTRSDLQARQKAVDVELSARADVIRASLDAIKPSPSPSSWWLQKSADGQQHAITDIQMDGAKVAFITDAGVIRALDVLAVGHNSATS